MTVQAKCYDFFNCTKNDCPAFGKPHVQCWLIAGTLCHDGVQGQVLEKIELCLDCRFFHETVDRQAMEETCRHVNKHLRVLKHDLEERDRELETTTMEMAIGFSQVFEALKAIASGDPSVRIREDSNLEIISKLKHMVNSVAENVGQVVDLSHEFAIGLAEHFDVLHRVSTGDLSARVAGDSPVELLELLKKMTNQTIEDVSTEMTERLRAEQALKESESKYRLIVNQIPEVVFTGYADWSVDFYDRKIESLCGYPKEDFDLRRLKWIDLIIPEDVEKAKQAVVTGFRTTQSFVDQYRLRKAGGDIVWVQVNGQIFSSPEGKIDHISGVIHDITEQKNAEQALRDSESHFRAVVSALEGYIYVCSQDYRIEFINEKLVQRIGYNPIGGQCHKAIFGLDSVCPWCVSDRVFQGETVRHEFLSSEDNRWYYTVDVPIIHPDGSVSKQSVVHDITERKHSEEEIKLNEMRLEALLRLNQMTKAPLNEICEFALEEGIRLTDSRIGYFGFVNADESVLTMHAWSRSAIDECRVKDLTHVYPVEGTGLLGEAVRQRQAVITNDYNAENPLKMGYPEGHVALHRHMNVPVFDGDRIVIVAGVGNKRTDYTDSDVRQLTFLMSDLWRILQRKQAEEALIDSEEKYRLLIGNIPAIAFRGYSDGSIEFFDDKIQALTGYTVDEFSSGLLKWTDLVFEDDAEVFRSAYSQALIGDKSYIREYRIVTHDNRTLWVQGRGRIICNENGQVDYVSGVIFDITERKHGEAQRRKLEMQLNHAHRMEAIGTLAGGIAHDFNNILAAMIGYAELAHLHLRKAPEDNQALCHLNEILRAGDRAKSLVNQILTFSRQTEQIRKPVEICLIIEEVVRFLRASIPSTVEIRTFLNAPGGIVMADPVQIHQVLINLCTNAYQAMEGQGGILEIRAEPLEVDGQPANSYPDLSSGSFIRIIVSDTGSGMSSAILERVFDPFFTTKQPGKGTGLGLSVVHGIVKGLGGNISVDSEIGKGTTFQVILPRHAATAVAESIGQESNLSGNERILYVDDETQLTEMATMALGEFGYQVTAFNSSLKALEAFRTQPQDFDLVITDLTMPHLTGIELAREIKRLRGEVPIILATGFSEDTAWEQAKEVGIQECLLKPIIISDLAKAVRRTLDDGQDAPAP